MHGAEGMLKPAMFGGWKDPPSALKLINPPQPLKPDRIDKISLRGPLGSFPPVGHEDILVDRIGDETGSFKGIG
jgi:hypothetical protein